MIKTRDIISKHDVAFIIKDKHSQFCHDMQLWKYIFYKQGWAHGSWIFILWPIIILFIIAKHPHL